MHSSNKTYSKVLTTKGLSIGYRKNKGAISYLQKELDLGLFRGELVCLIGPNGCGKSTLIRVLAALQKPLAGEVFIDGKDILSLSNAEKSELVTAVLTDQGTIENIRVDEIVSLGRYQNTNWMGDLGKDDERKIAESISKVGLSGFSDRRYGTLSDGEKQRTFIAKALASDALVMLLDEPTAHLDIPNKIEIMYLLRRLTRESGHSVLVSTHDLDLAMQLADEIWLMLPGNSIFIGTPEELSSSGYLDRVFGSKLLSFNTASGSFCISTQYAGSVNIDGKGTYLESTKRALQRMGFISSGKPENLSVYVNNNNWTVEDSHTKNSFYSLSEVCRFLRHINI